VSVRLVNVPTGLVVGGYVVDRYVASGSWGSVYEAHRELATACGPERVALKFIGPAGLSPALRATVVDREVRFALLAAHDGVVRTHGVLTVTGSGTAALDGALVLVMEWASTTCAELIAAAAVGGCPVPGATRLLTEVALSYADNNPTAYTDPTGLRPLITDTPAGDTRYLRARKLSWSYTPSGWKLRAEHRLEIER
jgi:hypothetical protein